MQVLSDKAVAFTGHRPQKIGGYDESNPIAVQVRASLEIEIKKAIAEGFEQFISGGALGVDTMAAEIVLDHGKQLIIARPFPSQHIKWPPIAQKRFLSIVENAGLVIDVSPDPYHPFKMQKRNIWMVDHSTLLIAVFDGTSGGTANCINYAKKIGREIRIIPP